MAEEMMTKRAVLNANKGVTNVIDYKVIHDDLQKVVQRIFDILSEHYGPYSGFAALESGDPLKETQFTKDGISIVRAIEFVSPQEDIVRKTVAYIGNRIETMVGDGTTTAMMFTCAMLKHMMNSINTIRPVSYNQLRVKFGTLINEIKERLDKEAMHVSDDYDGQPDIAQVWSIVYNQVYTSSHGDVELAHALAQVYSHTPRVLWDHMVYERRQYESKERFTVSKPEGQYSMSAKVMMPAMNNQDMGTWYENKNCDVYVMNDTLRMDCDGWEAILDGMDKSTTEKPFVLVCHERVNSNVYQELLPILNEHIRNGKSVAIFVQDPEKPQINDFVSLQLLAGVDITKAIQQTDFITKFHGVHVKFRNKQLHFDNLYEIPEEYKDSQIRFQCLDGKHLQYTDYVDGVKRMVDAYAAMTKSPEIEKDLTLFSRMYAKLIYAHCPILQIGGAALDNVAMLSVVDDCVRASSKALTTGVVFGNNRSLHNILVDMYAEKADDKITWWFIDCMIRSLVDIAQAAIKRLTLKEATDDDVIYWYSHAIDLLRWDTEKPLQEQNFAEISNCTIGSALLDTFPFGGKRGTSNEFIIQPANSDISMLERFAEVALKYVLTERIVVRNTAYVADLQGRSKK